MLLFSIRFFQTKNLTIDCDILNIRNEGFGNSFLICYTFVPFFLSLFVSSESSLRARLFSDLMSNTSVKTSQTSVLMFPFLKRSQQRMSIITTPYQIKKFLYILNKNQIFSVVFLGRIFPLPRKFTFKIFSFLPIFVLKPYVFKSGACNWD